MCLISVQHSTYVMMFWFRISMAQWMWKKLALSHSKMICIC